MFSGNCLYQNECEFAGLNEMLGKLGSQMELINNIWVPADSKSGLIVNVPKTTILHCNCGHGTKVCTKKCDKCSCLNWELLNVG